MQVRSRFAVYAIQALTALLLILSSLPSPRAAYGENPSGSQSGRNADIFLGGKLYCSLRRQVILPFKGAILSVKVQVGQFVKQGAVLATYRLTPEILMQLRRRLSPPQIAELSSQVAEVDKNLSALHSRETELRQLAKHNMTSEESLKQVERDLQILERRRAALKERSDMERQLAKDDLEVLRESLGKSVSPSHLPVEGTLIAPIAGYVTSMHSDLREQAEFGPGTPLFSISVMDPMLMRANVHEMEAMQIKVGDRAEVTIESVPGTTLQAEVSRISWAPLTPGLDQPTYYELELAVPNPSLLLRDGLSGQIVFRKQQ